MLQQTLFFGRVFRSLGTKCRSNRLLGLAEGGLEILAAVAALLRIIQCDYL